MAPEKPRLLLGGVETFVKILEGMPVFTLEDFFGWYKEW
jgi:hypothetical protein